MFLPLSKQKIGPMTLVEPDGSVVYVPKQIVVHGVDIPPFVVAAAVGLTLLGFVLWGAMYG